MKTMNVIPYILTAAALVTGAGCSSTSTGTGGTASTSTDTGTYSSTGGTTTGTTSTGSVGATTSGTTTTDATTTAGSGTGATGGASTSGSAAGMGSSGAGGATGIGNATATEMAADQTAFMATFATMEDPVFLINAASSNMLELQAGQMASQKATSPEVRKYAQMMVSHHSSATQQLKAVATPLGTKLPQMMLPVHQAMVDRLKDKSGKEFDEAYMDAMETAHKMDIAMFEVKSKAATQPTVQTFATSTLPMLRSHRDMADKIEAQVD